MTLPSSGPLAMSQLAGEFGDSQPYSLSEYYRGGGLVPNTPTNISIPATPGGQISLGNFYGASSVLPRSMVNLTISAPTTAYDVYTYATASPLYVAGLSDITVTINSGVTVSGPGYSDSNPTALSFSNALIVPASFNPADTVRIVNNGTVKGAGGLGGDGGGIFPPPAPAANAFDPWNTIPLFTYTQFGQYGSNGGTALRLYRPTTVTNNGSLIGGGGGGGGGSATYNGPGKVPDPKTPANYLFSGVGGGGGAGVAVAAGGAAGGPFTSPQTTNAFGTAGNPGTATAGGAAKVGPSVSPTIRGGGGGAGGGLGAAGSAGTYTGAAGPATYPYANLPPASGGLAGSYIVGSPFAVFPAIGTIIGPSA